MIRIAAASLLLTACVILSACATSAPPFTNVNLGDNLDPVDLARYREELKQASQTGLATHAGHHMATLEHTNWWPLGLVAWWKRGSVKAIHTSSGEWNYMITKATGWGPLATLFIMREQASFDSKGTRLSYMANAGLVLGHPFMYHAMGSRLEGGEWMQHETYSLLHHIVNIGVGHGTPSVWFLTAPNPAGVGD